MDARTTWPALLSALIRGDSLTADVGGAHAAGIRAVWVNHRGRTAPPDAPVAYEIADLSELTEVF